MAATPKKALFVIAQEKFRDEEYKEPKAVLEKAGITVTTASLAAGKCSGKLGMKTTAEALADQKAEDFDAVVFVGGPGCKAFWDHETAHKLLQDMNAAGKVVAGICSAVVTLARAGVMKGKRATVFPDDAHLIVRHCGAYTAASVETDLKLVTADGPASATAFGKQLVKIIG